jgi:hypothetical protein
MAGCLGGAALSWGTGGLMAAGDYEVLFGGPGPNTATDTPFGEVFGGTSQESFGFEVSFNNTQEARINALTNSGFAFSVSRVDTPTWVSGRDYAFSYGYSGDGTRQVTGSITDLTTNTLYTIPAYQAQFGAVQTLVVRMVAQDPDVSNAARPTASALRFTNWILNGTGIDGMPNEVVNATLDSPADDPRLISYFQITGVDYTQPWTLTGQFRMNWSGSSRPDLNTAPLPGNNDLAFQIKAVQTVVPEPSSVALVAGACALGWGILRRRQSR